MGHLVRLTSTPYLVLFIILGAIGVSTATAVMMITVAGNFTVTDDTFLQGNLDVGGLTTGTTTTDIYNQLATSNDPFLTRNKVVEISPGSSIPGCENTNSCFIPFSTVIPVDGSVRWTNYDSAFHTVTSGTTFDGPDGLFDSSLFGPGDSFTVFFRFPDTIPYFCQVHPWQLGEVVVTTPSNNRIVEIVAGSGAPGCEDTDSCLRPSTSEIQVGGNVLWVNRDAAAHTITSGTAAGGPTGFFDSGLILAGDDFSFTFTQAGTFEYFSIIQPWITGEVIVT